ncbi:hypothetical protein GCM10011396_56970 [Undibacterium terreum]|uniref:Uncharacterized protein n=1 Tax=Undibacterium terreum TaxID=1224302 RepID=A0A916XRZ7_9BURK|nr:hypothetical protein GCM10011396_56970 [Undibacterium terreum]
MLSDYRFRGISLSDGKPQPQLSLGYDSPAGWYVGAFGAGTELRERRDVQVIAYAGYAQRLPFGLTWEVGVTNSVFLKTAAYNYAEVYAGLGFEDLSGRIYVSPNYFGQAMPSVYAELNASHLIAERTHLLAHLGYLRSFSGADGPGIVPLSRVDALLGVGSSWADWRVQLAWVGVLKTRSRYYLYGAHNPSALTLSASYSF